MDKLEKEIRQAFESRLAAAAPRPDLRARLGDAVARRSSRRPMWQVAAASAAMLLVGAITFYALLARHLQSAPLARPIQALLSPAASGPENSASKWVQGHPTATPSARGGATMVYDAALRQMVLFGGDTLVGDTWVWEGRSAILALPSVIIAKELNYLINPAHPGYKTITIGKREPFSFDPRLLE